VSIRATSSRNSTRTFCSGVCSGIRVSIHLTSPSPHLRAPLGPLSSSTLFLYLQVRARTFGPCPDLRPCLRYDPNPCHPTPLGRLLGCLLRHPCLAPSYEFEPVPSGPTRTSVIVCVTSAAWIRTARNTKALQKATSLNIADFIFDVMCQFRCIPKLTMDNGRKFKGTVSLLADNNILLIPISPLQME
jgi:hypothetical protein